MNRILTASELEILQSLMLDDHYSYDDIVEACDYVSNHKRVLSLRTITQALTNKKCEVKPKKEMPQSLKDFYNKI